MNEKTVEYGMVEIPLTDGGVAVVQASMVVGYELGKPNESQAEVCQGDNGLVPKMVSAIFGISQKPVVDEPLRPVSILTRDGGIFHTSLTPSLACDLVRRAIEATRESEQVAMAGMTELIAREVSGYEGVCKAILSFEKKLEGLSDNLCSAVDNASTVGEKLSGVMEDVRSVLAERNEAPNIILANREDYVSKIQPRQSSDNKDAVVGTDEKYDPDHGSTVLTGICAIEGEHTCSIPQKLFDVVWAAGFSQDGYPLLMVSAKKFHERLDRCPRAMIGQKTEFEWIKLNTFLWCIGFVDLPDLDDLTMKIVRHRYHGTAKLFEFLSERCGYSPTRSRVKVITVDEATRIALELEKHGCFGYGRETGGCMSVFKGQDTLTVARILG